MVLWLKEITGFLCDEFDGKKFDKHAIVELACTSLLLPFPLDRYYQVNKDYFTDDITTVA